MPRSSLKILSPRQVTVKLSQLDSFFCKEWLRIAETARFLCCYLTPERARRIWALLRYRRGGMRSPRVALSVMQALIMKQDPPLPAPQSQSRHYDSGGSGSRDIVSLCKIYILYRTILLKYHALFLRNSSIGRDHVVVLVKRASRDAFQCLNSAEFKKSFCSYTGGIQIR